MQIFTTMQLFYLKSVMQINTQHNVIIIMQQTFTKCKYLLLPDTTIQTQNSSHFENSKVKKTINGKFLKNIFNGTQRYR